MSRSLFLKLEVQKEKGGAKEEKSVRHGFPARKKEGKRKRGDCKFVWEGRKR